MAVKKADLGFNREKCAVTPENSTAKKPVEGGGGKAFLEADVRVSKLLNSFGLGTTKTEDAKPKSAVDTFLTDCLTGGKEGIPEALKKTAVSALWRVKTGIGLKPEVAKALSGPMKMAALMFVSNPALARTLEGAEIMMQLLANVEGVPDMDQSAVTRK